MFGAGCDGPSYSVGRGARRRCDQEDRGMDLGRAYFDSALAAAVPVAWNQASRAAAIATRVPRGTNQGVPCVKRLRAFHVEQVRTPALSAIDSVAFTWNILTVAGAARETRGVSRAEHRVADRLPSFAT